MKTKTILAVLLTTIFIISAISPLASADTLLKEDFLKESFAKTVDFFDYARTWASNHSMTPPPSNYHAYLYTTYVNTKGLHMLYAGLCNISFGTQNSFTIPMQTYLMHYKTNNRTRDVILASTFLMLLAFNDTTASLYPDSPDMNDNLWSSFSMGFTFGEHTFNETLPALSCATENIPLTHSADNLTWHWGMKYTNLTAVWFRTYLSPTTPGFEGVPMAIATYDELTFTYDLTIDPVTNKATLNENHNIGRIRQLWRFWINSTFPWLHYAHYNGTGTYRGGEKISNETVCDFIQTNNIKMSIVSFQTSILADRETYCLSAAGQNVTDNEQMVSGSGITTYADDGEKVCDASFGTKQAYKLFNAEETSYDTFNSTTRTSKIGGFARNVGLFAFHIGLMKFMPLLVAHMYPAMFARALDSIANMSRARYFYIVAYPTYNGCRIEHDPTLTIYLSTSTTTPEEAVRPFLGVLLVGGAIAAVIILAVLVIKLRKKPQSQTQPPQPPTS